MNELEIVTVTFYNPQTGELLDILSATRETIAANGGVFVEGRGRGDIQYVNTTTGRKELTMRPVMPVVLDSPTIFADGEVAATISRIPEGATVCIRGREHVINDGILQFSTVMPGDYPIRISKFPYLDWEGSLTAMPLSDALFPGSV